MGCLSRFDAPEDSSSCYTNLLDTMHGELGEATIYQPDTCWYITDLLTHGTITGIEQGQGQAVLSMVSASEALHRLHIGASDPPLSRTPFATTVSAELRSDETLHPGCAEISWVLAEVSRADGPWRIEAVTETGAG